MNTSIATIASRESHRATLVKSSNTLRSQGPVESPNSAVRATHTKPMSYTTVRAPYNVRYIAVKRIFLGTVYTYRVRGTRIDKSNYNFPVSVYTHLVAARVYPSNGI